MEAIVTNFKENSCKKKVNTLKIAWMKFLSKWKLVQLSTKFCLGGMATCRLNQNSHSSPGTKAAGTTPESTLVTKCWLANKRTIYGKNTGLYEFGELAWNYIKGVIQLSNNHQLKKHIGRKLFNVFIYRIPKHLTISLMYNVKRIL